MVFQEATAYPNMAKLMRHYKSMFSLQGVLMSLSCRGAGRCQPDAGTPS
jgi:hypothetical protein